MKSLPPRPGFDSLFSIALAALLAVGAGAGCASEEASGGASLEQGVEAGASGLEADALGSAGAPQDAADALGGGQGADGDSDGDEGPGGDGKEDAFESADDAEGGPAGDGEGEDSLAEIDLSDLVYDVAEVLQVEITMAEADWDELRWQTRDFLDVLGPGCLDGPADKVFTWFEADVAIDGEVFGTVGVRKKGFLGSLSDTRPSLKVRLDKYVAAQELHTVSRLTFNNNQQDPSRLQTCLTYSVFTAAGLPAPRCSWAHVYVNGKDLGIYSNVEPVKRPFLERHFGTTDGDLYEGTLSDFRPEWMNTFEAKTSETDESKAVVLAVIDALEEDDDELEAALEELIDLDQFFEFWAAEVLVSHWDGYAGNTNNFYIYADPADEGRLSFVPWGADGTFGDLSKEPEDPKDPDEEAAAGEDDDEEGLTSEPGVMLTGALPHRLWELEEMRDRYVDTIEALLDEAWDEEALSEEVSRLIGMLSPELVGPSLPPFLAAAANLHDRIAHRRAHLEAALVDGPPDWHPPLREGICLETIGTVHSELETTWAAAETQDPFQAGTGSLLVELEEGEPPPIFAVGVIAGPDDEDPTGETAVLATLASIGEERLLAHLVKLPTELVQPNVSYPLGFDGFESLLFILDFGEDTPEEEGFQFLGWVLDGTLELGAAGHAKGDPIEASFQGTVLSWF